MRVALDAQLTVGTATGIGEYVSGLVPALRRRGVDVIALREPRLNPWRFDRRVLWDQLLLPLRVRNANASLLHCAAGTLPWIATLPVVVTVHDVAWLATQRHARAYARYYFGEFSLRGYARAARIIVDSHHSRAALLGFLRDFDDRRVAVVYPGVADEFCRLERRSGDGRTILAVGTVEPRKNLELLVAALARLSGARLVAVGPTTPYAARCLAVARRLGVADRFELRGYVSRDTVLSLYRSCAVVAVPSVYEGFGYAAAQALCAGVPCIASDRTSLPEIAGDDAQIVPVEDLNGWIAALQQALEGGGDARASRARAGAVARFSWESAAAGVEQVYARALEVP
ncbi:MAG: glycosyltransferase family 4 protein [Candidatus Eremiobacteraeota bacterium]|nr:glycosyltransferase family 4 protein [Candidatus Eremiobacteraeota bacterium]